MYQSRNHTCYQPLAYRMERSTAESRIIYKVNEPLSAAAFIELLQRSTLAERRPVDDPACMEGMVNNSNLMISAWDGDKLVGIARSLTDFHYACYLSDLAVHSAYQGRGIGKRLQHLTQQQLGPKCWLILIAAPNANSYYRHIGFTRNERCWMLRRDAAVRGLFESEEE